MMQSGSTPARFRTIATLRLALVDLTKFEEELKKSIKDEKEAQEMYVKVGGDAVKLIRIDPVFPRMNTEISGIYRDEKRHEGMFAGMLRETQDARKRLETELEQSEARERYPVEMGVPRAQITGPVRRKWR